MGRLAVVVLGPDRRSLLKRTNDIVFNGTQGDIINGLQSFPSS